MDLRTNTARRRKVEDDNDASTSTIGTRNAPIGTPRPYADYADTFLPLPDDPEIAWDNLNNPVKGGSENRLIRRGHLRGHDH